MAFERVYTQASFPSGMNDAGAFGAEVLANPTVGPIYSHMEESGTTITVRFTADSSAAQDAACDAVVAAHGGAAPPGGTGSTDSVLGIVTTPMDSGTVFGSSPYTAVRIGGASGGPSMVDDASLELGDKDAALLVNRLTTTERDAVTAVAGMVIFNTTIDRLEEYDGTEWRPAGGGSAVLMFGADNVSTSVDDYFLFPSYVELTAAAQERREFRVPRDGVIRNMFVQVRLAGLSAGDTITYTLEVDSSPSALTVTMGVTDLTGEDTTNLVSVTQGQRVGVLVEKSGLITESPKTILVTMEFV